MTDLITTGTLIRVYCMILCVIQMLIICVTILNFSIYNSSSIFYNNVHIVKDWRGTQDRGYSMVLNEFKGRKEILFMRLCTNDNC